MTTTKSESPTQENTLTMTTTKSESPTQEKKGDNKMKKFLDNKEEEQQKSSKKKEQQVHSFSDSPKSIPFNASKPPSAPTLQDSLNLSLSDGDFQMMVVAGHSHSSSVSDGTIKVIKTEEPSKTITTTAVVTVMNVEDVDEKGTSDDEVSKKKGKSWYIVLLGLRIAAFVFCKIAFSVLAADQRKKVSRRSSTNKYWYGYQTSSSSLSQYSQIHWYDYQEFKYCLSVNIIGFVYSGLQICDLVKYLVTKRHTMDPKLRGYFNFAMDQTLAYLLMSASSSSATIAYYWTNLTSSPDKYVEMANASVALSFVAFVAFAASSIVSAFIFCRFKFN